MTESYTDGVTSVLGEGHHRRRGEEGDTQRGRGLRRK